jgi:L-amino acid N-acyltransferase YncA
MDIIIREATEKDLPGILTIYNDAIVNTTAVYDYKPHTMEMRTKWFDDKMKSGIPVFVAEQRGEITGFASFGPFRAWAAYKYSVEHSVYVHPGFRRQGIARKLLEVLINAAREKEIHTIIAGIDADNSISLELHRQMGFEEAGHLKQVGYKFGRWLDLKFMQLILINELQPTEE